MMEEQLKGSFGGPNDRRRDWEKARHAAWCFYCGRIGAWFLCDCVEALEARRGDRVKPRSVVRDGKNVLVLEPGLLEREWNKSRLPVYGKG